MSASFPPLSGSFNSSPPMYPNQGFNFNDPFPQGFNGAPGSSYPPNPQGMPNQQAMMKPTYDPRTANGYNYPPNGSQQLMSPSMVPGQYPSQQMRPPQGYYPPQQGQMGQMGQVSMQKTPSSGPASAGMGPPNGMPQMMMHQQGQQSMNQMPTNTAGPAGQQMPSQMKSPMPGQMPSRPQQMPSQMNSPGVFTAPAPPRPKHSLPSPGASMQMGHPISTHPMGADPSGSSSSANQMPSQNQMKKPIPPPPTQDTPFTTVTHYEMPPAFLNFQNDFQKVNPDTAQYYNRRRSQLKMSYPTGQLPPPEAMEPATFAFIPGQAHYEQQYDRRNMSSVANQRGASNSMVPSPMAPNPMASMMQRQMSAPGITSPSYGQQQLMAAPTQPAAKKTKRSASTSVDQQQQQQPPYYQVQNRMMSMGTFNNPNLKSPAMMPMGMGPGGMGPGSMGPSSMGPGSMGPPNGMGPMSSMNSMPPSSMSGPSSGMMAGGMGMGMGQNGGMSSNGMPPSSMSHAMDSMGGMPSQMSMGPGSMGSGSNGMGGGMSMAGMSSNGGFATPLAPPPYSQMPMPSSSQHQQQAAYNQQMQQRYGNGLMSPGNQQQQNQATMQQHQQNPSPMQQQQNGSQPNGTSRPQMPQPQRNQMFMQPLPPCNTCKAVIPPGIPAKVCANPGCRRAYHLKCAGLTDAATSMLDTNSEVGWICPVCDPRPR